MIRSVKNMRFLLLFLLGDIFIALPAYAQEESYPLVSADVVIELQSDWGIDSDDPDEERNNTFMRTEVAPTLSITDNFFIDGTLVLEPVLDPDPGEDNFFEDEGVFVEELKLNYVNGSWSALQVSLIPVLVVYGILEGYGVVISLEIIRLQRKLDLVVHMFLKMLALLRIH